MGQFIKGDIVVVPFPFSDLSNSKRRPAFVVRDFDGDDLLLCQITSQALKNEFSISINENDFISGSLNKISNIRPDKIFTCSKNIILYKIGALNEIAIQKVIQGIIDLINE